MNSDSLDYSLCWNYKNAPFNCSKVAIQPIYNSKGDKIDTYECTFCIDQIKSYRKRIREQNQESNQSE